MFGESMPSVVWTLHPVSCSNCVTQSNSGSEGPALLGVAGPDHEVEVALGGAGLPQRAPSGAPVPHPASHQADGQPGSLESRKMSS